MTTIEITRKDTVTKARSIARVEGFGEMGELTLSKLSERTIIADHTAAPEHRRGQGVAKALVERLVADARAAGQKIVPLCPYVKSLALKNQDAWADVIQG